MVVGECAAIVGQILQVDGAYALSLLEDVAAGVGVLAIFGVGEIVVAHIREVIACGSCQVETLDGIDVDKPFAVEGIVEILALVIVECSGRVAAC